VVGGVSGSGAEPDGLLLLVDDVLAQIISCLIGRLLVVLIEKTNK